MNFEESLINHVYKKSLKFDSKLSCTSLKIKTKYECIIGRKNKAMKLIHQKVYLSISRYFNLSSVKGRRH